MPIDAITLALRNAGGGGGLQAHLYCHKIKLSTSISSNEIELEVYSTRAEPYTYDDFKNEFYSDLSIGQTPVQFPRTYPNVNKIRQGLFKYNESLVGNSLKTVEFNYNGSTGTRLDLSYFTEIGVVQIF